MMATKMLKAVPVLPSPNLARTVEFFVSKLGFEEIHLEIGKYAIVERDHVELHFFACDDKKIAEASGCRVEVQGIESLYAQCEQEKIVHPNGPLADTPWGTKEFAVLEPEGNCVTFFEEVED